MMFSLYVRILLGVLATYRVAELMSLDFGPYNIFQSIRSFLGRKASSGDKTWKTLADLVNCPFCLGIWFSVLAIVLILLPTLSGDIFLLFMGVAGGQCFLESLSGGKRV